MLNIVHADAEQDVDAIRELFWEHLVWANEMVNSEFELNFDIQAMLDADIAKLTQYFPPTGLFFMARYDGQPAGTICMRHLYEDVGELKRMYVRPAFRGQSIGRALVQRLLEEAPQLGITKLRLDSARFMTVAHALYRSVGFYEIEPYPSTDIPLSYQPNWIFMERLL